MHARLHSRTIPLPRDRTLRVHLRDGEGPPVVLIHGALLAGEDMALAFAGALPDARLIAPDRPGHGESRRSALDAGPIAQAHVIAGALDALGTAPAAVIGHSFGGAVALALALARPDLVARLALVAPLVTPELRLEHLYYGPRATPFVGALLNHALATADRPATAAMVEAMFAPQAVPPAWRQAFPLDRLTDRRLAAVTGEDSVAMGPDLLRLAALAPSLRTPLAIFAGDRDGVIDRRRHAALLATLAPGARYHVLEGLGHMAHHAAARTIADALAPEGRWAGHPLHPPLYPMPSAGPGLRTVCTRPHLLESSLESGTYHEHLAPVTTARPLADLATLAAQLRLAGLALLVRVADWLGAGRVAAALRRAARGELRQLETFATGIAVLMAMSHLPRLPPRARGGARPAGAPPGFVAVAGDANAMRAMRRRLFPHDRDCVRRLRRLDAVLADIARHSACLARHIARVPPALRLAMVAAPAFMPSRHDVTTGVAASDTS